MNRKLFSLLALPFLLTACGGEQIQPSAVPNDTVVTTQDSLPGLTTDSLVTPVSQRDGVDVDLTKLSSTMVYAEVANMMYLPEEYVGKTIRMQGQFAVYEEAQDRYYACIIPDATACCSQGLEFVCAGKHSYPADYPEPGAEITVQGEFQIYEEDGLAYVHLTDADFI